MRFSKNNANPALLSARSCSKILNMNKVLKIQKAAFIARVNKTARAVVVDTYYKQVVEGDCFLMLVYADGTQKQFVGLRHAR